MADLDLSVRRLMRILESLGTTVEFTDNGYVKARRALPDGQMLCWMQHCHRGINDTIPRLTVRAARRGLHVRAEDGVSDERFYSVK